MTTTLIGNSHRPLNFTQQQIAAASSKIHNETNGRVYLTSAYVGAGLEWYLYRNGIKVNAFNTVQAHAFVTGWTLCKAHS